MNGYGEHRRMITQNLHTHSTFDDGQNTMEEMVRAAISAGLHSLGFSVHTPAPDGCAWEWAIAKERLPAYAQEARRLREAYRGRISVYHGAEWEMLSSIPPDGFDYVIGSIHHIVRGGEAYSVDASAYVTADCLARAFGGDADAAVEAYFAQYADLAQIEKVDIVGHFDLPTKFDEQRRFYDPDSPRFHAAALSAMDALNAAGKIFEINTGAIARGYRTAPYPSRALLLALKARGGRVAISADAHCAADVAFGFAEAEALARACGFTETWVFDGSGFVPAPLGADR